VIRERQLPSGWYPDRADEVRAQIAEWGSASGQRDFDAVIVPHAGWFFSGGLAFRAISRLRPDAACVVVVGGHLHPDDPVMLAPEDGFATPLGTLSVDENLRAQISEQLPCAPDRMPDNTVEVQMPLVASVFPDTPVVCLRAPPSAAAVDLGVLLARYRSVSGRPVVVVASTDMTHYGESYGFAPHGSGAEAVEWVKSTNDARLVEAFLAIDPELIVTRALREHSACSSGAPAAAAAFAGALGDADAELVDYYTSYDVMPNASFVGYAGVGYRSRANSSSSSSESL
jgi:AmmeMemoRadiSam system protein B